MTKKSNTARMGAGEAAALEASPLLYDHMPLANSEAAAALLTTAGVLSGATVEHHVSCVLQLNPDAQMEELCEAIAKRARAVRGALTLLECGQGMDDVNRAVISGAGLLIDELCGLSAAVALSLETFDRARGAM